MDKEWIEKSLGELNSKLREELIDTKLVSISDWNNKFAPALSDVAKAIEGSTITARTYKLPLNYFEE